MCRYSNNSKYANNLLQWWRAPSKIYVYLSVCHFYCLLNFWEFFWFVSLMCSLNHLFFKTNKMNLTPTDQACVLGRYFPNTNVSCRQGAQNGHRGGGGCFTSHFNFLPSDVRRQSRFSHKGRLLLPHQGQLQHDICIKSRQKWSGLCFHTQRYRRTCQAGIWVNPLIMYAPSCQVLITGTWRPSLNQNLKRSIWEEGVESSLKTSFCLC